MAKLQINEKIERTKVQPSILLKEDTVSLLIKQIEIVIKCVFAYKGASPVDALYAATAVAIKINPPQKPIPI